MPINTNVIFPANTPRAKMATTCISAKDDGQVYRVLIHLAYQDVEAGGVGSTAS